MFILPLRGVFVCILLKLFSFMEQYISLSFHVVQTTNIFFMCFLSFSFFSFIFTFSTTLKKCPACTRRRDLYKHLFPTQKCTQNSKEGKELSMHRSDLLLDHLESVNPRNWMEADKRKYLNLFSLAFFAQFTIKH